LEKNRFMGNLRAGSRCWLGYNSGRPFLALKPLP
jgi:hypothetical protein